MKQACGPKKLARCRQIGGKEYETAWVRGGREHFWAECWHVGHADWVNYKTGEVRPYVRQGQLVEVIA